MGLVCAVFIHESQMCVHSERCCVVVYGTVECLVALLPRAFLSFLTLSLITCAEMAYLAVKTHKILRPYLATQCPWSKIQSCAPAPT